MDLGNILAGGSGTEPTETPPVLELDEAVFVNGIDLELAELLVDLTDNSLATDSGGKCVSGDDSVSCGSQAGFSAQEGDLLIGLRASEMIPLEGFDQSYVFMALFDSDGDSSNNRVGIGELDPYHGTDLWYLMDFDLDFGWNFRTWRVGEGGSIDIDPTSNAFGLIQNDMAWLIIPSSELPQVEPWAQVAIARYDDNYLTGLTGIDPLGELVTDPMVGLDGSRVGGHVTGSAGTSSSTVLSYTPTMVPYGGILDVEFCLFGSDGNPWAGQDVAATLGDPPSSTTATHASGTTGGDGCVRMPLEVNEPEGESTLHVFDGTSVMAVSPITVVEPTGSEAVYLEDFDEDEAIRLNDLLVIMSALFVDVETSGTRGNGDLHTVEDPLADQDNPFFSNPVDQKDDTLPLVWDVVGFNLFSIDPGDNFQYGWNGQNTLVHVEPASGNYSPQTSGNITVASFGMAGPVDASDDVFNSGYWCFVSLFGRDPNIRTTLGASVGDENDPRGDTNVEWSMWVGPGGETVTTKHAVNPDTGVPQRVESHATLGVISDWTDFAILIPTSEIEGLDLLKPAAGCTPPEYTDYNRHTRDVLGPVEMKQTYAEAYLLFGSEIVEVVESETRSEADDDSQAASQEAAESVVPELAKSQAATNTQESPSNAVPAVLAALGIISMGAGAWAYRKASRPA